MRDLNRFIKAQEKTYEKALNEIKNGHKETHWMWYIFPQIKGLGYSETSKYYAINDISEARQYLNHPILSKRLIEICNELLKLDCDNPNIIFGYPDDMKLKSSMTLFKYVSKDINIFNELLDKFFNGKEDEKTKDILFKN